MCSGSARESVSGSVTQHMLIADHGPALIGRRRCSGSLPSPAQPSRTAPSAASRASSSSSSSSQGLVFLFLVGAADSPRPPALPCLALPAPRLLFLRRGTLVPWLDLSLLLPMSSAAMYMYTYQVLPPCRAMPPRPQTDGRNEALTSLSPLPRRAPLDASNNRFQGMMAGGAAPKTARAAPYGCGAA